MDKLLGIIAKTKSDFLVETLTAVIPVFQERGWSFAGDETLREAWEKTGIRVALAHLSDKNVAPALCLSLGGDGTLLSAVRLIHYRPVPIIAINLGSLGFIASHPLYTTLETIEKYFGGHLKEDRRHCLTATLQRQGQVIASGTVLNDVVVSKGSLSRMIELAVFAANERIGTLRADGLVVSTPTGSTAYSFSSGGPIVHPHLDNCILSPICPHSPTWRPIVLDGSTDIRILLLSTEESFLSLDGQVGHALRQHDEIIIQKSDTVVTLLKDPNQDYFGLLREKLNWGSD